MLQRDKSQGSQPSQQVRADWRHCVRGLGAVVLLVIAALASNSALEAQTRSEVRKEARTEARTEVRKEVRKQDASRVSNAVLSSAVPGTARDAGTIGLKVSHKDVLWGNAHRCKAPAELDLERAINATAEGRKIEDEGIEKGSARYDILMAKAQARVRRVVRKIAIGESRDCVVKSGSYRNPEKLDVVDLTDLVIAALD